MRDKQRQILRQHPFPPSPRLNFTAVLQAPLPVLSERCNRVGYIYSQYIMAYLCSNFPLTFPLLQYVLSPGTTVLSVNVHLLQCKFFTGPCSGTWSTPPLPFPPLLAMMFPLLFLTLFVSSSSVWYFVCLFVCFSPFLNTFSLRCPRVAAGLSHAWQWNSWNQLELALAGWGSPGLSSPQPPLQPLWWHYFFININLMV